MIIDPGFPEHNIVDSVTVHGGSSLDWRVNIPGGEDAIRRHATQEFWLTD